MRFQCTCLEDRNESFFHDVRVISIEHNNLDNFPKSQSSRTSFPFCIWTSYSPRDEDIVVDTLAAKCSLQAVWHEETVCKIYSLNVHSSLISHVPSPRDSHVIPVPEFGSARELKQHSSLEMELISLDSRQICAVRSVLQGVATVEVNILNKLN